MAHQACQQGVCTHQALQQGVCIGRWYCTLFPEHLGTSNANDAGPCPPDLSIG